MGDGLHIDPQTVAQRCTCEAPDYRDLTPLDWVVLDFTDGMRTFDEILETVPTTRERLAEAYVHLRLLGFLTWRNTASGSGRAGASQMGNVRRQPVSPVATDSVRHGLTRSNAAASAPSIPSASGVLPVASAPAMPSFQFPADVCAAYIPQRLFSAFRRFSPKLFDVKFDLSPEMQAFVEFIYDNLSDFSPYEILGIDEGMSDKRAIRQAYMQRTKLFHPDRYFRKNLGPFAPRIAAIFKAVSGAFAKLQAS